MDLPIKRTVRICGKEHTIERRGASMDDVTIDGLTIDAFLDTLSPLESADLAMIGLKIVKGKDVPSPQKDLDIQHQKRSN